MATNPEKPDRTTRTSSVKIAVQAALVMTLAVCAWTFIALVLPELRIRRIVSQVIQPGGDHPGETRRASRNALMNRHPALSRDLLLKACVEDTSTNYLQISDEETVPRLSVLLVLRELECYRLPETQDALSRLLHDDNPRIRAAVAFLVIDHVRAFGLHWDLATEADLRLPREATKLALTDPDDGVRRVVMGWMVYAPYEFCIEFADVVKGALADPERQVRLSALHTIWSKTHYRRNKEDFEPFKPKTKEERRTFLDALHFELSHPLEGPGRNSVDLPAEDPKDCSNNVEYLLGHLADDEVKRFPEEWKRWIETERERDFPVP